MKAALLYKDREGLSIEEIDDPRPGPGEVLVRVDACGLCGTDVHLADKHIPTGISPVIPGHEIAGTVVEAGAAVRDYEADDAVLVFPQIFCGECYACRSGSEELCVKPRIFGIDVNGGFAEFIAVPERVLMRAPEGTGRSEASLFAESVSVAYHAIFVRGGVGPGESVLVAGAGGLGTNAIRLLATISDVKIFVMDLGGEALARAEDLGASVTIDPGSQNAKDIVREHTNGEGVDAAFDFTGNASAIKAAYGALKKGGRLVLCGVGGDRPDFGPLIAMVASGRTIIPSFGYSRRSAEELRTYVSGKNLSFAKSVSETFGLDDVNRALETLKTGSGRCVRLVIEP